MHHHIHKLYTTCSCTHQFYFVSNTKGTNDLCWWLVAVGTLSMTQTGWLSVLKNYLMHYCLLIYVSSIFTTSITILDFSMCIFRSFLYFVLLTTIHVQLNHIIDIFSTINVSKWIWIHLNHHFIMYFNPNIWNAPCIFLSSNSISK